MGSFTVLRDVGETVKLFLRQNIPELSSEDSIRFDSPADIKQLTVNTLSMFLYQIVINTHLRNIEPKPAGLSQMEYPPLIIDLFYLFTPYGFEDNRETEFIILERIMQLFHDHSVLRGEMLQGNLVESQNDEIRIVANTLSSEDLTKLWERFPETNFKLSISYMLTPVRIPSEKRKDITRIIEKDIDYYMIETKK